MKTLLLGAALSAPFLLSASNASAQTAIRILVGDRVVATGVLNDSRASRDLLMMLPLEIELSDYHGTEKIADLPGKLSSDAAPAGHDPSIGEITYYAPWGNLALFYRDFGYSRGLVKLGKLTSGLDWLMSVDNSKAVIELEMP